MIREYRPRDIEDVLDLWYRASRIAHPFLSEEVLSAERIKIRDVHMPAASTWIWEEDGRVLGFIALMGNEVGALFVAPESQGRGVGTALMDNARMRYEILELEVFEANAIGRSFYAKYGFVPIDAYTHEETNQPALRLRYVTPEG